MLNFLKSTLTGDKITDPNQIDKTYKYWRVRILYSMYSGYVLFYFTRKGFVFILPALMHALHYTKEEMGLLGTVFYITYGVSKFISGMLSDRSNPRYFMAIGLIITGIATIFFGLASSLIFLIFFWLVNAFFQGWGWPPCARLLTQWYSQRERGIWWGIWNTSHNVGGAVIPLIAAICLTYLGGWRSAMIIPGVMAILVGLWLVNRLRDVPTTMGLPPIEEYKHDFPNGTTIEDIVTEQKTSIKEIFFKYVFKNKYIWILAIASVLIYIIRTAFNDWGSLFLTERGYSLAHADEILSFFDIGGFFGSLFAGFCSDKIFKGCRGQINVFYAAGIIFAIFALWGVHGEHYIIHATCIFAIGFFVFGPQMLVGVAAAELSHREAAGTATGFIGLFGYIGAALSGLPVGYITQNWGWGGFFITMLCCGALLILLLIPMWSVKSNPQLMADLHHA